MERVADGICIRPNAFLLKLLLIARTAKVNITKREVGYYVLNSLDVLQGKANPYEVLEAITQDQKAGIERTIYVPDKKSSYNWQHINEQMNYLELANLIRFTDDKRVVLNPNEMPTIELYKLFMNMRKNEWHRLIRDWQTKFSLLAKQEVWVMIFNL